jgi:hypothetical protein
LTKRIISVAVAFGLLSAIAIGSYPAIAENDSDGIGILTGSVVLEKTAGSDYVGEAVFSVFGPTRAGLEVDLIDVWTDENGERTTPPAGSTPLTGLGRLEAVLETNEYIPNGEEQLIRVKLRISGEDLESNALAAGVRLKVTNPPGEVASGNAIGVALQALIFVYASSENYLAGSEAASSSLEIRNLGAIPVGQMGETGAVSPVGFIEGGQVAIAFNQSNLGNLFTFVTHRIEVRKAGWFASEADRSAIVFEHAFSEATLLPGQSRRNEIAAVGNIQGSESVVNLVEGWGMYQVDLITSSRSGSEEPVVTTKSATFIVFPFRGAFALLILLVLLGIALVKVAKGKSQKPEVPLEKTKPLATFSARKSEPIEKSSSRKKEPVNAGFYLEAPPPLDTWDFLRSGREGMWSKDPEPLEGKSKKQTSTKSKKNA